MIKILTVYILVLQILSIYFDNGSTSQEEYGAFDVTIRSFDMCRGPKRKECCKYSGRIVNKTSMIVDIEVLEDMTNLEGKIVTHSDNKQQFKLPMKKLCDHIFWRPLFERFIPYKNCAIKKGKYRIDINVQDIAGKYLGNAFIYGNWTVKAMYFNDKCNFACALTGYEFSPK